MTLQLHNTLTRSLEPFAPEHPERVTLYTCGPTVYDYLHVGNWAAYIYWDTLVRTLRARGLTVERVMNITDVGHLTSDEDEGEDKLEKGARREGKTAWEVAAYYTEDFLAGMTRLNLIAPEHITKATDYIPQQLDLVRTLHERGYTYQIDDGIYFDTGKFPTYADFAQLDLDAQRAGARVEYNTDKRNPSDFALWKFTPTGQTRDMQWETPVDLLESPAEAPVYGFPGWHLECSAMAMSILGSTIDILTGGIDHIPVHHTNEIAQSEAATGQLFSRVWLHNNHLKVGGTKISKSLGNGYTLDDLEREGYAPLDYRLFVLQSHYRSEGNFTLDNLAAAARRRAHWRNVAALRHQVHDTLARAQADDDTIVLYATSQALVEAIGDDLATPAVLMLIDEAFARIETASLDHVHLDSLRELLTTIDDLLGLDLLGTTPDIDDDTKQLILARERARDARDWAASDEARDELLARGIVVRDTPAGTIWQYA